MSDEKLATIDIPESIESYKVTLFWGLTITQIILVFIATLFTGFAILSLVAKNFLAMSGLLLITALALLGIVEIRGRNFYKHILFILAYYKSQPRVLIYNHYAMSGKATVQARQLVYQQEDNKKTFLLIFLGLAVGLAILILIGLYLYHVIHS